MPLQGLRRRIPACSPGDLPASEIWGHPQRGQGHPCPALGGARVQPGAALLATGVGRRAENFWEAGEGGMSLLPSSLLGADIYFHISMHKLSLCQSRGGWDGNGAAGAGSAWVVPSSAPSSISSMLDSSPNAKLQKMLMCLSVKSHCFHHRCGNNSNLIIAGAGSENTHSSQQLSTSIPVGHSCSAGSPPRLPGTTEDSHLS